MSTTVPAHLVATCPHCGKRAKAHVMHAERRTRCRRCGGEFRLPAVDDPVAQPEDHADLDPKRQAPSPTVSFDCRVCQTHMSVPVEYVGRKIKCPDCGAATKCPPPPPPKKPDLPAALFAETYDVYEGEDQPWAADLMADGPRAIALECGLCQSLLHADESQVGQAIVCPDCGAETVVRGPAESPARHDVTTAGYGVAPPEVVEGESEVTRLYFRDVEAQAEKAVAELVERPELPPAPLLTGLLVVLRSEGMAGRVFALVAALACSGCLFLYAIPAFAGVAGGRVAMMTGAIMGVCLAMLGALIGVLCFSYLSALVISIVTESSEGNDRLHDPPSPNPTDWFGQTLTLGVAVMTSAAPGWIVGRFVSQSLGVDSSIAFLAALAGLVVALPFVLLSQLDVGSPWGLFSIRLAAAAPKFAGSLLLFLAQSAVFALVPVGAVLAAGRFGMLGWAAMSGPLVLAVLLYARLVGRLAWVIAERTEHEPGA